MHTAPDDPDLHRGPEAQGLPLHRGHRAVLDPVRAPQQARHRARPDDSTTATTSRSRTGPTRASWTSTSRAGSSAGSSWTRSGPRSSRRWRRTTAARSATSTCRCRRRGGCSMDRTEIRVTGYGGQGVVLISTVIGRAWAVHAGKHAAMIQSFGPEARGSVLQRHAGDVGDARCCTPTCAGPTCWWRCRPRATSCTRTSSRTTACWSTSRTWSTRS